MIRDIVVKLMEEANEEAEHKGWCNTELFTNEQTRKEKVDDSEELTTEVDEFEAWIARLTQEITDLTEAVEEFDAATLKSMGFRETEKAKNTETIADAQAAHVRSQLAQGRDDRRTRRLDHHLHPFEDEPRGIDHRFLADGRHRHLAALQDLEVDRAEARHQPVG